jgi:hypothetical protein
MLVMTVKVYGAQRSHPKGLTLTVMTNMLLATGLTEFLLNILIKSYHDVG